MYSYFWAIIKLYFVAFFEGISKLFHCNFFYYYSYFSKKLFKGLVDLANQCNIVLHFHPLKILENRLCDVLSRLEAKVILIIYLNDVWVYHKCTNSIEDLKNRRSNFSQDFGSNSNINDLGNYCFNLSLMGLIKKGGNYWGYLANYIPILSW